jgi:hypothetical protein
LIFVVVIVRAVFGPANDRATTWWLAAVAAAAILGGIVIWQAESRRRTTCSTLRARALDIVAGAQAYYRKAAADAINWPEDELLRIASQLRGLSEYAFSEEVDELRRNLSKYGADKERLTW